MMEFKAMVLGHFLVVSLALNMGLLYREYSFKRKEYKSHVVKRGFLDGSNKSTSSSSRSVVGEEVIDLNHGDPTMYEAYWRQVSDKTTVVIPGWKFISYFSDERNLCWFLEPEFGNAVIQLHKLVGNAVTDDRHIVVGTGSTQLFQAVLYAVSQPDATEPISIVSAAPFYSNYQLITEFLKSGLYTWAGDAHKFKKDKPYVELVTNPNNPDGASREPVVNQTRGILVHDLAYYWPQYTPITTPADHNIMLFTVSKSTGHAGSRLGWALVKDAAITRKMTEFIVLSSIGVSKESQFRAAKILQFISDTHECRGNNNFNEDKAFFDHSYSQMARRWQQLRDAVKKTNNIFSLPEFPTGKCTFSGRTFATQPAFAWLRCEGETEDCESSLRGHRIITRSGKHFGDSKKYVRISVLPHDEVFENFIERLSNITSS